MRIATGEEAEDAAPENSAAVLGNRGGAAREKKLTPEERKEIAKKAAETGFRRMIQVLEGSPNLAVVNAMPEQIQRMAPHNGWQVRHVAVIGPRAILPVPLRVMSLRAATENAGPIRVMLTIRFAGPPPAGADQALAIPPPARAP